MRRASLLAALLLSVAAAASAATEQARLSALAPDLAPEVLSRALDAIDCSSDPRVREARILAVIDYSLPSTSRRLWVFDRVGPSLLYHTIVAHGRGSGENYATKFSNREGSHQTSLGLFLAGWTYQGRNGYSLRLEGLDPGVNDKALERAIVIHGAWYVSEAFAKKHGRLGRSWGCPALDESEAKEIIDTLRGGGVLFAYANDDGWLARDAARCDTAANRPTATTGSTDATDRNANEARRR